MNTEFVGENLLPGILGNIFISLAFAAALTSTFAYYLSTKNLEGYVGWKKLGKVSFGIHTRYPVGSSKPHDIGRSQW